MLSIRKHWPFIVPLAMLGMAALMALGGAIVMWLWNGLLPTLFGLHRVTFWQALGLLVLCRILFAGWGGGAGSRARRRAAERWDQLTPEERERFRQSMRGGGPAPATGEGRSDTV